MNFTHSIRWRIMLWNGLLWIAILTAFGVAAWRMERNALLQQLDQEIEARHSVIEAAIRRETQKKGGAPPPPPDPTDLSAYEQGLFEGPPEQAFYYVIWRADQIEVARSTSAPADVPVPERIVGAVNSRTRGNLRERYWFTPRGECSLVGHSLDTIHATTTRMAGMLFGLGTAVLAFGLSIGWWISTRALRPIADISAAALKIAEGDLSQRVSTNDYESELGQLAKLLNTMFDRLAAAFEQQARFTADAAHELRTPLAIMLTHAQNGLVDACVESECRKAFGAIERAANRMKMLTESLLQLARIDAGSEPLETQPLDLATIAQDAARNLTPFAATKHVSLDTDLQPAPCHGDAILLGQVASNLITNAITYNIAGGYVRIQTSTNENRACLRVTNSGPGIPPEEITHLFERFYRLDKSRTSGNAGLGLPIAKAIIELHHGTITITSTPKPETIATIQLP